MSTQVRLRTALTAPASLASCGWPPGVVWGPHSGHPPRLRPPSASLEETISLSLRLFSLYEGSKNRYLKSSFSVKSYGLIIPLAHRLMVLFDKERQELGGIGHDGIIGAVKNWGVGVGIYRYHALRAAHTGKMLWGAGNAQG